MKNKYKYKVSGLRIPKFLFLFFLLIAFSFSMEAVAQNSKKTFADANGMGLQVSNPQGSSKKISLNYSQVSLKKLLKYIEQKEHIQFTYEQKLLHNNPKVTVNVKDATLNQALKVIFKNTKINFYAFKGGYIVLREEKYQQAQETVTGTVTDSESGETLPGVNILVKGTSTGTSTDKNGEYELQVESLQDTLVFSYIGYKTQQVPINGRTKINIMLKSQVIVGQQLVVTGYGQQESAQNVTGAVSSVQSEELEQATTTTNTVNMLSGKLPGLRVKQNASLPGAGSANTTFDIRGFGDALIVIDGVPGGDLNRLNPSDIKNISVLKGANAAIYGFRAANGVVLVTTKSGQKGQTSIHYKGSYGWSKPTHRYNVMNAYQFTSVKNSILVNEGQPPAYSKETVRKYKNGTLPSTDWQSLVERNLSPQTHHTLDVDGGSDNVAYHLSVGYLYNEGIWKSGDLNSNQFNFRSNVTSNITDNLTASLKLSGYTANQEEPGGSLYWLAFKGEQETKPTTTPYANGNPDYLSLTPDGLNPLARTNTDISGYQHNNTKEFTGILRLSYEIPPVKGLQVGGYYSYNVNQANNKVFNKSYPLYTYDNTTETYTAHVQSVPTTLDKSFDEYNQRNLHLSLRYNRTLFKNHKVKALFLFDQLKTSSNNFNGSREFAINSIDYLYGGQAKNQQVNSDLAISSADQGYVGRLHYSYKLKYLVSGSFRYDGSSKFAPGHQWGFFPAISGGWRISSEPFMDNVKFIDNLLLNASYGKTGDDSAADFQFLTGYNYPGGTYIFDENADRGLSFRGLANQNLTWYTAKTLDIGLKGNLWNGKLSFNFDVFRRRRSGLLATRTLSLPGTVGANLPQENLNNDENRGFEFQLSHKSNVGKFRYNVSGNVSFSRHKNLFVERSPSSNSYSNWRNNTSYRYTDVQWGYDIVGRFNSKEEIKNAPVQDGQGNQTLLPGDFKYQDYNGDGVIDDKDEHPIGRNGHVPEINFGFTLNAQWKRFAVNLLFQGGARSAVDYLGATDFYTQPLFAGRQGLAFFTDRWRHKDIFDVNSPWVPGKYPAYRSSTTNYEQSTFWLYDASYIRLKSAKLSYTFKPKFTGFRSLRIFASGFNLVTISDIHNFDPAHPSGLYGYRYPIDTLYQLGLEISL